MKGVDDDEATQDDAAAKWFEDGRGRRSSPPWLHAAALDPKLELADIGDWLATSTYTVEPGAGPAGPRHRDPAALR